MARIFPPQANCSDNFPLTEKRNETEEILEPALAPFTVATELERVRFVMKGGIVIKNERSEK